MPAFNIRMLLLLSLGHLVTDIYQGALPTILPFLKEKLGLSYTMTGTIIMISSLTSSVIQPLFGIISDKRGKAVFLPFGVICAGTGFSLLAVGSSYTAVLIFVLISGLGIAAYHPEGYKTARLFTGKNVATSLSIFTVGGNLGFALGPTLSILVITLFGGVEYLPILFLPALLFVSLLLVSWKTLTTETEAHTAQRQSTPGITPGTVTGLVLVILSVVARSWTQFGLMAYIPFYYIDHVKGDPLYAGTLVSTFLLGGVAGTLSGAPLADRWGHKKVLTLSLGLSSLIFPLIFFTEGMYAIFFVFALLGMVLISSFTITIVMAHRFLPNSLGMASGLTVGFAIGMGGIGVTILGIIADAHGVPAALKCIGVLPVIGFLISLFIRYPPERGAAG
ncbi:MAG TPA: MFS transporter [Dissulfurispiraceae bacterium]|nr:MFS transporter [Dissulfurispiraceae bacterium]